jgi:hypothetical protein
MPEPLRPAPAKTYGRENWIYIPTIASAALQPTVAEATAASALDITRIAFKDGEPMVNSNTERVRQDERAGDTESYEFIGRTDYEGGDVMMAWQPQAAPGSDGKKAWEKFPAGTTGFLAKREDIGRATNIIAGQRLSSVVPVEFGPPIPTKKGEGSAAQAAFKSTFAITGAPAFDVVVLA